MQSVHTGTSKLLTIDEAAALTGLSSSWIRTIRRWGPLEPAEKDGLQAVTAESVDRFLARRVAKVRRRGRKADLRLVWINPNK